MTPIALQRDVNDSQQDAHFVSEEISFVDSHHSEDGVFEPIAVVGLSFKFPQDATTSNTFWQMLKDGRCAMTEWPRDRVNIDAFYHPDDTKVDTIPFRGGHFLQEPLWKFDAPFFSITSAEAAAMDPQQRLLLETAYRALENAGISLAKASGSNTSVYTGCFTDDYKMAVGKDPHTLPVYAATGLAHSMLAARLSWFFNFTGPCVNLDSACSSSMMAFDLACQGLRNGDTEMALVGGANIAYALDMSLPLSNMNFVSHDSRSFSFDDRANGYGRGEGFGVVVLKRLTDALKDGDTIRAVVRSTGSNQDGHTPGITQPSKEAQLRLIKETYEKAGLKMQPTRYVEAHGTGTVIGDPVEASAIGTAFREVRSLKDPMFIGAVKSNIGHLEGASGIAGIIKTILILEAAMIPPNANFEVLNPSIDTEGLRIAFPRRSIPWPSKGLRRASVMSFGFGGSNSQVIMDDAYNFLRLNRLTGSHCSAQDPPSLEDIEQSLSPLHLPSLMQRASHWLLDGESSLGGPKLLVWSTADEQGLKRLANVYSSHMSQITLSLDSLEATAYLESLSYTLATRRTSFSWKSFLVARSVTDLAHRGVNMSKPLKVGASPKLGFVFTGQGAQFAGMAKELLLYPVFRTSLRRSEAYLADFGCRWSLIAELLKESATSNIDKPEYSQSICTALQIALVDLLRKFGIAPSAIVGHSSGEIAAAYCLGYLSHRSACKVAFFRGQCAARLIASGYHGAMMAVGLSEEAVELYLNEVTGLMIGCVNSPKSVTITGDEEQIDTLKSLLDKDSIFSRKLRVKIAYHSPQMYGVAAEYLESLGNLEPGETLKQHSSSVMISTVTGKMAGQSEVQQGAYWVENMISQVKFSAALGQLCPLTKKGSGGKLGANRITSQVTDLLEIGPHSALQGPIKELLSTRTTNKITYSSVLRRQESAMETLLEAVGYLYCAGYPVDVYEVNQLGRKPKNMQVVLPNLPEYPFDHSRDYWHESRLCKEGYRLRKHPHLDLLGTPVPDWNPQDARWRGFLQVSRARWIEDHKVNGTIVYPAAGMLVMALEAAKQMVDKDQKIAAYLIRDVSFHSPLAITSDAQGTETHLHLRPLVDSSTKDSSCSEFSIWVNNRATWSETCRGTIQIQFEEPKTEVDTGKETKARLENYRRVFDEGVRNCTKTIDRNSLYEYMKGIGLEYGPSFQALHHLFYDDNGVASGKVDAFEGSASDHAGGAQPYIIHPTTLDGLFQMMLVALSRGTEDDVPTVIPTRISKLWIVAQGITHSSASTVNVHARAAFSGRRKADGSMFAMNSTTNDVLVSLENTEVTIVAMKAHLLQTQYPRKRLCYNLTWKPDLQLLTHTQVSKYCEESRPHRASDFEFYESLGFLILKFMSDALDALADKNSWDPESHLRHYHSWSKHQLDRFHAGQLPHLSNDHPKWRALLQSAQGTEDLINQVESTEQGKFFVKIGRNLLQILEGILDPLAFMFQDDSIPQFYREINNNVICYEPFNRYIDVISHKNPGLKILEIGAGTGATTDFVLHALSGHEEGGVRTLDCTQYDYTDISPAFFESAASRYKQPQMRFKVLDIQLDPSKQGFEFGTYDLIIAASVLHATKNLEVTMRNARSLLKPGGKLIIFEVTEDIIRARFAFGLLPGWWLSEEDYRRSGPCISTTEWDNLLQKTGFSGADVEIPDYVDKRCHEYTIITSTAIEPTQASSVAITLQKSLFTNAYIIIDHESVIQQSIANRLKDHLLTTRNVICDILSLDQVSAAATFKQALFIFLVELEKPLLANLDEEGLAMLQYIVTKAAGLLWITSGGGRLYEKPELHLVDGFARVSQTEFNKLIFVTLALEDSPLVDEEHLGSKVHRIFQVLEQITSQTSGDFEPEYMERNGNLEICRVVEASNLNHDVHLKTRAYQQKMQKFGQGPPLALHVGSPGSLDSLKFVECIPVQSLEPGELEIKIQSTGVNFLDCLTALGQVDSTMIGGECAGIVTRVGSQCEFAPGDRVASLARNTYRTYTQAPVGCVTKIPNNMSFAEASALPVVFCTAWIALHDTARLQAGESILIHSGAGGTGQAAIQVAKYLDADIYVTVGSDDKKRLLMKEYDIPDDHIFYSRNTSFSQGIMRKTNDRGVNVVLNSLSGEGLLASWECVGPLGRFIEIGKRDINSHGNLPMWQFRKNVTFSSVDLITIIKQRPSMISKALTTIMTLLADDRFHVPQPFQVFGIAETEGVFRRMQGGENSGKMAVELRDSDVVSTVLPTKPDYLFDANATYLIAGGLGGLGRSAAKWLARRGAKYLILLSRSGARSETSMAFVEDLKSMGVHVSAPACDVANLDSLSATLSKSTEASPPVKGVIQASMILKDAILEKMTIEEWKSSLESKVKGSWNLHSLLPQKMDFFICLSSIAGIIGSGGQANYAAGNTYMDALMWHRVAHGEKATSLDLGWMESEGVVAKNAFLTTSIARAGHMIPISQDEFFALLDHYCNPALVIDPLDSAQAIIGPEVPAVIVNKGLKEPQWMQRRTFRHLRQIGLGGPSPSHDADTVDYATLLRNAPSLEDAGRIITKGILQKLSRVLSIPSEELDVSKPLHAYGVDSLLAVELRNYFAKEMGAEVAIFDIVGGASFNAVSMTVAKKSQFCPIEIKVADR